MTLAPSHPDAQRSPAAALPRWAERLPAAGFAVVRRRVPDAADLSPGDLADATAAAYAGLFAAVGLSHPVRFWNVVPHLTAAAGDGTNRYMAFNAGRYRAFAAHYGDPATFADVVPTASAVGTAGPDLHVACLAAAAPGVNVGNPRQVLPHRYSAAYGKLPPCFARATRVGHLLLIGGTASIRGESSRHAGDLARQLVETLANLDAVLAAAGGSVADLTDLRVYHPRAADASAIRRALPPARRVEFVVADLCRPELLVEVEAVADLGAP